MTVCHIFTANSQGAQGNHTASFTPIEQEAIGNHKHSKNKTKKGHEFSQKACCVTSSAPSLCGQANFHLMLLMSLALKT
jgi:hypothetical protein